MKRLNLNYKTLRTTKLTLRRFVFTRWLLEPFDYHFSTHEYAKRDERVIGDDSKFTHPLTPSLS